MYVHVLYIHNISSLILSMHTPRGTSLPSRHMFHRALYIYIYIYNYNYTMLCYIILCYIVSLSLSLYIYIYIYIHMYIHIYTCTHIYIYTHMLLYYMILGGRRGPRGGELRGHHINNY